MTLYGHATEIHFVGPDLVPKSTGQRVQNVQRRCAYLRADPVAGQVCEVQIHGAGPVPAPLPPDKTPLESSSPTC